MAEFRTDFEQQQQQPLSLSFAVDNDVHSDLSGVSLEVLDGGSTPFLSLPVTCNYGAHAAAAAAIGQQVVKYLAYYLQCLPPRITNTLSLGLSRPFWWQIILI